MTPDSYQILGVQATATTEEIRAAYRRLARLYHPDLNSGPEAESRMQEINEAYDTLSDPLLRRRHDFSVAAGRHSTATQPPNRRANRRNRVVVNPRTSAPIPQSGEDIEVAVFISQREANRGVRKTFSVGRMETCPRCRGTGLEPEETFTRSHCWRCTGGQRLHRDLKLHATIPSGVSDGRRLRLRGQGSAGVDGGTHGHIYVTMRVRQPEGRGRMLWFLLRHLVG